VHLVSRHVHLTRARAESPALSWAAVLASPRPRLDDQAQAQKAIWQPWEPQRRLPGGRDRRRLSRRGAQRRQEGQRFARPRRRSWAAVENLHRGQANPLEVAPRAGLPSVPKPDRGRSRNSSTPAPLSGRPDTASGGRQSGCVHQTIIMDPSQGRPEPCLQGVNPPRQHQKRQHWNVPRHHDKQTPLPCRIRYRFNRR